MSTNKSSPKGKRLLLFKVLAILLPFVLLFLLEAGLRIFNCRHNTALFVKYPKDDRFMQMQYYASDKFFSDTINATKGNSELFTVNKAPNTFRIFVLDESTTIGYPYFQTLLKPREVKLTQLLNNVIKKVKGAFSGKKIDNRETLMKHLAARQEIAYGSKDYQAGIEHFDKNMTELCALFNNEKIPVFFTVVSNEKDRPPFISAGNSQKRGLSSGKSTNPGQKFISSDNKQ